jgi:hypothetical protein
MKNGYGIDISFQRRKLLPSFHLLRVYSQIQISLPFAFICIRYGGYYR